MHTILWVEIENPTKSMLEIAELVVEPITESHPVYKWLGGRSYQIGYVLFEYLATLSVSELKGHLIMRHQEAQEIAHDLMNPACYTRLQIITANNELLGELRLMYYLMCLIRQIEPDLSLTRI